MVASQGPFYCAQGTILYAETKCMDGTLGGPDIDTLVALTYSDAKLNFIDDPSNLKNDKVFVFAGKTLSTSLLSLLGLRLTLHLCPYSLKNRSIGLGREPPCGAFSAGVLFLFHGCRAH